jgi:uncharacterized membrane protein
MIPLIIGLALFLGPHSVRIVADGWRSAQLIRLGEARWKGLYSLVSIIGLALIVWGYGMSRTAPVTLYDPAPWMRHATLLLTLVSFVLIAASRIPGTRIGAAIHHPMVAGVKLWAFAHLLSNGGLADVVLFGTILAWSVASFSAARRRDRVSGTVHDAGRLSRDGLAVVAGIVLWYVFARWLHAWLIGVPAVG